MDVGCPMALSHDVLRCLGILRPGLQLAEEQPTNKLSPVFLWSDQDFAKSSHLQLMVSVHALL